MPLNTESQIRRLRKAMKHVGQQVTYSNVKYDCFPMQMRDTQLRNRDQTFRNEYMTSIAVLNNDVTISRGDKVTYNGTERRVMETSDTADGIQRILHLGKLYGDN